MLIWVLYSGLALSIFFAFADISGLLGLQFNIGFAIGHSIFVIISKHIDPIIWLTATLFCCASSSILSLSVEKGERYLHMLYSVTAIPVLGLYLNGHVHTATFASLLFALIFLSFTTGLLKKGRVTCESGGILLTCVGLLGILIFVESYAFITQVLSVWVPQPLAASGLALQAQLSEFLFSYSPEVMLVAIFLWILVVPLIFLMQRKEGVIVFASAKKTEKTDLHLTKIMSFSMMAVALILAVFIPISPYLNGPGVSKLRGVDTLYYLHQLLFVTTSPAQLTARIGVDHTAPYVLLLYMVRAITQWDPNQAVIAGSVVLAIFFVLASYFLAKEVTASLVAAGIAAILAAASFHTTVGLYAGIFENWLAMSLVLVYLLLLHRAITKPSRTIEISAIVTAYSVLLVHIWTWTILIAATAVAALLNLTMNCRSRRNQDFRDSVKIFGHVLLFSTLPVIFVYFAADLLPGFRDSMGNALWLAGSMSFSRLIDIVPNLSYTLDRYAGAFFTYPLIPLLSIMGMLSLARLDVRTAQMFAGWLISTSVPTIFSDPAYQWRILYVIPFEVLAAAGGVLLLKIIDWLGTQTGVREEHSRLMRTLKVLLVILILIDCGNYGIRSAGLLPFA
jgi:hypothetical protein